MKKLSILKFRTSLAVIALSTLASTSFAVPRPVVRPDPERITVTGSRLPGFPHTIRPVIVGGSPVGGGGVASTAEKNSNGVAKGKEKKEEAAEGKNTFWPTIVAIIVDKAGIKDFLKGMVKSTQFESKFVKSKREYDENGTLRTEEINCFEIANSSDNKNSCVNLYAIPTEQGVRLEFQRLINLDGKLVYSTADTISFEIASIEDLYTHLNAIDPSITF